MILYIALGIILTLLLAFGISTYKSWTIAGIVKVLKWVGLLTICLVVIVALFVVIYNVF